MVHKQPRMYACLQWMISLFALAYALWGVEFKLLWHAMEKYPLWPLPPLLCLLIADYACMGWRLQILLKHRATYGTTLRAVLLCFGYNNILPAKAGDVLKVLFIVKTTKASPSFVLPSIVWERGFDCLAISVLLLISIVFLHIGYAPQITFAFLLSCIIIFVTLRKYSDFFCQLYTRLPHERCCCFLQNFHKHTFVEVDGLYIFKGIFSTLCTWLLHFATYFFAIKFVANFDLTFIQIVTVFIAISIGTAIPSSPGAIGVFEGAFVFALSWFDIDPNEALSFSIYFHMLYFIPVTMTLPFIAGRK